MIWAQTYTGKELRLSDPWQNEYDIEDIARSLSQTIRFNGHCLRPYTTAQHSVLLARHCRPENRKAALLHDAAEMAFGDNIAPVKRLVPRLKELEDEMLCAILAWFKVSAILPSEVKELDLRMLATERDQIMAPPPKPWIELPPPLDISLRPIWTHEEAYNQFMKEWQRCG